MYARRIYGAIGAVLLLGLVGDSLRSAPETPYLPRVRPLLRPAPSGEQVAPDPVIGKKGAPTGIAPGPQVKASDPLPAAAPHATDERRQVPSVRETFITLGRIVAVQRRKGAVRIGAPELGLLARKSTDTIRRHFLEKRKQLVIRNRLHRPVGTFEVTRVQVEYGVKPRRIRAITLYGLFRLRQPAKDLAYLSVGYAVGYFRKLPSYLPPSFQPKPRLSVRRLRHATDGKWMVFVPSSHLVYGQGNAPQDDNYNPYFMYRDAPVIPRISAFYMDRTEVTNHEYWIFCRRAGHAMPPSWKRGHYPPARRNHPFTEASYRDAEAYARWAGKRLPSEWEWELVARGSLNLLADGSGPQSLLRSPRLYPFGNDFDQDRCNTLESGHNDTLPVDRLSDESPYGAVGMCGNAREWTSSWFGPYPGHRLSRSAPAGRMYKVIRGGSFAQPSSFSRADHRDYGGFPSLQEDRSAGFRLVVAAE